MLDNSQTPPLYFTHSLELHMLQSMDLTGFLTECPRIFSEVNIFCHMVDTPYD